MDKNAILNNAAEHLKKVVEDDDLNVVEVPEWKCTLYFPSTLTLYRKDRIFAFQKDGSLKSMAQILIECAMDEDGKRIFSPKDFDTLVKHTDSNVVIRVAGEMSKALIPPEDDGEGKPEGAQASITQ